MHDAADPPDAVEIVDLDRAGAAGTERGGDGVHWSLSSSTDLNANLVRLGPGREIGRHRNDEVDVLLVVRGGDGTLQVDDVAHGLAPGTVALVAKGSDRSITAGAAGLEYLTVHRRRGPLQVGPRRS